jgi:uncharacterized membrane protein (UPF0127 family)
MRALLPIFFAFAGTSFAQPSGGLPTLELRAGMYLIRAEVAADFSSRATGLMYRKQMPSNAGMLFVFDEPGEQCMWMKNTLIPLSVAFMDDSGAIVNIEDMQPQTLDSHCARRPARYALEMNLGWFAARGIKPGMRLGGIPGVK